MFSEGDYDPVILTSNDKEVQPLNQKRFHVLGCSNAGQNIFQKHVDLDVILLLTSKKGWFQHCDNIKEEIQNCGLKQKKLVPDWSCFQQPSVDTANVQELTRPSTVHCTC